MQRNLMLFCLVMALTTPLSAQSRFGIGARDHHSPPGALITSTMQGYPCQQIYREGDDQRYYLAPYLHVITEINGVRIGTAQECTKAVFASPPRMKFRVYNRQSGSHRYYEVVLLGQSRGKLDLGRSLDWQPGRPNPKFENVVASPKEGHWRPSPGYVWVEGTGVRPVRWKPGKQHPDHHIMATREGDWTPMPGHDWVSDGRFDLRVRWKPGKRHPEHRIVAAREHGRWFPMSGYEWVSSRAGDFRVRRESTSSSGSNSYARRNSGSESFGLSEQFYRQIQRDAFNRSYSRNFNHAPVQTGPNY